MAEERIKLRPLKIGPDGRLIYDDTTIQLPDNYEHFEQQHRLNDLRSDHPLRSTPQPRIEQFEIEEPRPPKPPTTTLQQHITNMATAIDAATNTKTGIGAAGVVGGAIAVGTGATIHSILTDNGTY